MEKLNKSTTWKKMMGGVSIEIIHWGEDEPLMNHGRGIWNHYVYIYEANLPKVMFESIWLPDQPNTMLGSGRKYVSHDYYGCHPLNEPDWHGGITFYAKHGQLEGTRCVQVGCDYNHLHDEEHTWTLEQVLQDAEAVAKCLIATLQIQDPNEKYT